MLVSLGDVSLHVRDDGPQRTGTPVLLLHGWPDTGELWRELTPRLGAAGHRVLAPDLRGFGASSRPAETSAYSVRRHVGDVVGLLDSLGIERVHLVGHDWGAAIAWLVAAHAPERVRTLTALSAGHPASFRSAGWRQAARSWYMVLFQVPGVAERWLSAQDFRALRVWAGHPDADAVADQLRRPGALTASLAVYRAAGRPMMLAGATRSAEGRALASPPPVSAPTLGVWGRRDPALTERQMTGSARHVTGPWRYERFEECGHWIPLEAPQRLGELLLDFFATS